MRQLIDDTQTMALVFGRLFAGLRTGVCSVPGVVDRCRGFVAGRVLFLVSQPIGESIRGRGGTPNSTVVSQHLHKKESVH